MVSQNRKKSKKASNFYKVVIAGDKVIDEFYYPCPILNNKLSEYNFGISYHYPTEIFKGGINLIADFLIKIVGSDKIQIKMISDECQLISREILKFYDVDVSGIPEFGNTKKFKQLLRGKEFLGTSQKDKNHEYILQDDDFDNSIDENVKLFIIHDIGAYFRKDNKKCKELLDIYKKNAEAFVILKINPQYSIFKGKNKYYIAFLEKAKSLKKLIIIVNLKDIRINGANINYQLSWEKTTEELLYQIFHNNQLNDLRQCEYLVVRIGLEGALVITNPYESFETARLQLFFIQNRYEDDFLECIDGNVQGISIAFLSGFASDVLVNSFPENMKITIGKSLMIARKMWFWGYGDGDFPIRCSDKIFKEQELELADIDIEKLDIIKETKWKYWTILEKKRKLIEKTPQTNTIGQIAYNVLINGIENSNSKFFPILKIENLISIDRSEIESYHGIQNIIKEYIESINVKNPISIAVFGQPGSGKNFGIEQIVKNFKNKKIKLIAFNLSQFTEVTQLTSTFHKIRDITLDGSLPVVLFDEFDCTFNNSELGWIKYFLAPMQDGTFFDGENIHPIGRSIFVFAGGTSYTYQDFCDQCIKIQSRKKSQMRDIAVNDPKIRDFISRLRGYINVIGCDPVDEGPKDNFYKIRRALILRSILYNKHPQLFENNKLNIDPDVQRAFIKVNKYKHGIRSIQAIIEMSNLKKKKYFDKSALPSFNQINLHTDSENFLCYISRNVHFEESVDKIVNIILNNDNHLITEKNNNVIPDKEIIKNLVKQMPECLNQLGYGYVKDMDVHIFNQENIKNKNDIDLFYKNYIDEVNKDKIIINDDISEYFAENISNLFADANFRIYMR
jgi:hypothetical protein